MIDPDVAVRTLGGAILVLAAALSVASHNAAGLPTLVQLAVATIDASLGAALIIRIWPAAMRLVAIMTFGVYACYGCREAILGLPSCGCFGTIEISPVYTAAFDLLMVLALAAAAPVCNNRGGGLAIDRDQLRRRAWSIAAVIGVALVLVDVGAAYERGRIQLLESARLDVPGSAVILETSKWRGKRLPLLDHVDIGSDISNGDWAVILYHSDCSRCRETIPGLQRQEGERARMAFVEMPPYAARDDDLVPESSRWVRGKLRDDHEWFAPTPVVLVLQDGVVRDLVEGELALGVRVDWDSMTLVPAEHPGLARSGR